MLHSSPKAGIGMLETLVGLSVLVSAILILMAAFNSYITVALRETNILTATYLAEEGIEAVRSMRDASFSANIAPQTVGTPYHLIFNGTDWDFTATPQIIDGKFNRTVTIDQVRRSASDSDIADPASGEPIDPETKKVTVTVSWDNDSRTIVTYITDLFDN